MYIYTYVVHYVEMEMCLINNLEMYRSYVDAVYFKTVQLLMFAINKQVRLKNVIITGKPSSKVISLKLLCLCKSLCSK